jgi:hypothetical protein
MEDEDASCELELPLFIELKQSSSLNDLGKIESIGNINKKF